jgi:hypothetical protein
LAGLLWWLGKWSTPYVAGLALIFVAAGYLCPAALAPVERGWMKFGDIMSRVMTRVVLGITFFLALTPLALLARLVGRDELRLKRVVKKSYWEPVDPAGPASRADVPY